MEKISIELIIDKMPETIRAAISKEKDGYRIFISKDLPPEEKATAAAHELYHLFSGDMQRAGVADRVEIETHSRFA